MFSGNSNFFPTRWLPVVDGDFLSDPKDAFFPNNPFSDEGRKHFNAVPFMFGYDNAEGILVPANLQHKPDVAKRVDEDTAEMFSEIVIGRWGNTVIADFLHLLQQGDNWVCNFKQCTCRNFPELSKEEIAALQTIVDTRLSKTANVKDKFDLLKDAYTDMIFFGTMMDTMVKVAKEKGIQGKVFEYEYEHEGTCGLELLISGQTWKLLLKVKLKLKYVGFVLANIQPFFA